MRSGRVHKDRNLEYAKPIMVSKALMNRTYTDENQKGMHYLEAFTARLTYQRSITKQALSTSQLLNVMK